MKPIPIDLGLSPHSRMTRTIGLTLLFCAPLALAAQGGDAELRSSADALFAKGEYAKAYESYQTLLGNDREDFDLNFRYGTCVLFAGVDKDDAILYLKRSTQGPTPPALAWYFLGKAYHQSYRFQDALKAYERFKGTADKKMLIDHPVDALELQCRNGMNLLSNLKEIEVHNKVEVDGNEFFRFYDLSSIGGRIVVTPEELMTNLDRKRGDRSLIYIPDKGGPIWFASYGKSGETGRDIYRTELLTNGQFASPVKLAGYINTDQDEDFPFLAPDGRTFYFSSKGHNSMGGYDVFRSTYDQGLDVFGPPINLDFAVNTPSDEMLYLTDPSGGEACFASGRDSKQGALHVYRVSTSQSPINITVLKGTFASLMKPEDRKAHIIVQDAMTQVDVADVRTDIDGNYVLALPKSGRYRFLVEAGDGGRTHVGTVDVPRNDAPKAYRQEMSLVEQGGERLLIKNYFEAPLNEDMIALAMDEIKRRARLDVSTPAPMVSEQQPAPGTGDDVITQAGFAGNVTKEQAMEMAHTDAQELSAREKQLEERAAVAYSMALENATQAEAHIKQAEGLIAQAQATTDETERNRLMTEAARLRSQARAADRRANAALQAGNTYDAERAGTSIKAQNANKLDQDLPAVLAGTDQAVAVAKLKQLRMRMDEKNAPDGSITATEKMRRAATEREREAARMLQRANAGRADENELADRVARKKREEQEAKGGKKATIAQERAELERQLALLHEENGAAFARARAAENITATARGQADLAKHLDTAPPPATINELTAEQVRQLSDRISGAGIRLSALAVDERFEAAVAEEALAAERTQFNWSVAPDANASGPIAATTIAPRDNSGAPDRAQGNTVTLSPAELAAQRLQQGGQVQQPALTPDAEAQARRDELAQQPNDLAVEGTVRSTGTNAHTMAVTPSRTDTDMASARGIVPFSGNESEEVTSTERRMEDGAVQDDGPTPTPQVETPEERAFVLSNELAELQQLRMAEKNKARKDSLDQRIADIRRELSEVGAQQSAMSAGQQGSNDNAMDTGQGAQADNTTESMDETATSTRPAMMFPEGATEETLIVGVFPDYEAGRVRMRDQMTDPQERRAALHGLELMLVDSIEAENVRQLAALERSPAEATTILARVDRLRQMKEQHVQEADRILAEGDQSYAAQESKAMEDAVIADASRLQMRADGPTEEQSLTPHNDAYVKLAKDPEDVYSSVLENHSTKQDVGEAVRERDRDLILMVDLEDRIDSMEEALAAMENGKEYDALREKADRVTDDHMIMRTEIGQRMAYIMREEFKAAQDSAKGMQSTMNRMGLPANEPLLLMASNFEQEAKQGMATAAQFRKMADRSEKIETRDSLLRLAYTDELLALKNMDRAITARNYVVGDDFKKGEQIGYEDIEQRMFGVPAPLLAQQERPGSNEGQENRAASQGEVITDPVHVNTAQAAPAGSPVVGVPAPVQPTTAAAQRTEPEVVGAKPTVPTNVPSTQANTQGAPAAQVAAARPTPANPAVGGATPARTTTPAVGSTTAPGTIATTSPSNTSDGVRTGPVSAQRDPQTTTSAAPGTNAQVTGNAPVQTADPAVAAMRAKELEDLSIAAADRASALEDSATAAPRAKRDVMLREAVRQRQLSDSLHLASMKAATGAYELQANNEKATQAEQLRKRLAKYYYLQDQEQALVINADDMSRYFEARSKALEQREEAAKAHELAASTKALSDTLLAQSGDILANPNPGGAPLTPEQMATASRLSDQAVRLAQRADSLRRAEDRLKMAATMNESQAGAILQGLEPQRGTDIMALEQRTRRTEPGLAMARANAIDASNAVAPGRPVTTAVPSIEASRQAEDPAGDNTAAATPAPTSPTGDAGTGAPRLLDPLTSDIFTIDAANTTPDGPIPVDAPMPAGVVFKVQIGAFRHDIAAGSFGDLAPVHGEHVGNGITRYTAGMFTSPQGAVKATAEVREQGYRDAFVVAYQDGRRIPLAQAMHQMRPAGGTAQPQVTASVPARPAAEIRPVVTPISAPASDSERATEAEVMAKYPATPEQLLAQFAPPADATAYYNDPKAAPARQVETVKGLFFTVQVGVYSKPTALDKLFNITPLNSERTETQKIRYTTGIYVDMEKARARKDQSVGLGVKDAFITAYLNGKRIPMRDARALISKFGAAVFVEPAIITR